MFKKLFDSKVFRWIRYVREQLQNQRQNRQLVGEDREGNKYYQYYSYWGLPIRRQIRWKKDGDFVMKDLVYYRWLHHQQFDPPTKTQKEQFYLEEKIRYEKALEWDQKQILILQQFRTKKEQLALRDQALAELQKEMEANSTLINIKTKRTSKSFQTQTKQSTLSNTTNDDENVPKNQKPAERQKL